MADVHIEQTKLHPVFRRINTETFYRDGSETSRLIDDAIAHCDGRQIRRQLYKTKKDSLLVQGDAYEQHKILTQSNNIIANTESVTVTFHVTTDSSPTMNVIADDILIHAGPDDENQVPSSGNKSTLARHDSLADIMIEHGDRSQTDTRDDDVDDGDTICLDDNIPLINEKRKRNKKGLFKKCQSFFKQIFKSRNR